MGIVLDTPEQINAWILLSRMHQCELHMKGYTVKGLFTWLKNNVPDVTTERTVKDAYPRLLDYMDTMGVYPHDHKAMCNYQILVTPKGGFSGLYFDYGIVASIDPDDITDDWKRIYADGRMVIMRTMDKVRDPDKTIRMVMGP